MGVSMKNAIIFFLLAITFVLISCAGDSITVPDNKEVTDRLEFIVDSIVANSHVPGCVAGIWAPKKNISWVHTTGYSNLEDLTPMTDNLLFRIGSNTKTFTNTALLQLIDQGKLALEDKVEKFFPDLPESDKVTVKMLTDMTSGYFNYSESDEMQTIEEAQPEKVWLPDELIDMAMKNPLYFTPGTDFHYSNTNTILIGMIIEQVSGKSLKENIEENIISKLGLNNTYFLTSGVNFPAGNFARGYYNGYYDESNPDFSEVFDISWAWAAGSGISNLYDMKTYVEALVGGGLISDSLQQIRLDCTVEVSPILKYSIGIMYRAGFYGHAGELMGYNTYMMYNPEEECTIIILTNSQLDQPKAGDFFAKLGEVIYPNLQFE